MPLSLETMRKLYRSNETIDARKCGLALNLIEVRAPDIMKLQDSDFKRAQFEILIEDIQKQFGLSREIAIILISNSIEISLLFKANEEDK